MAAELGPLSGHLGPLNKWWMSLPSQPNIFIILNFPDFSARFPVKNLLFSAI
jgi:hypothetical protein